MTTVRNILREYEIRPRRRWGQSFLEDKNIIKKIIEVADIHSDDLVVEIGAGLGIMTDFLADKARQVIALDVDRRMIEILQERLQHRANVTILEQDVLFYDFSALLAGSEPGKVKIVGNIPYNISTPILFHLLKYRRYIYSMVLMFQKEVAERIVAVPGTKAYGIPSVSLTMYGLPSREMTVPASCFCPPPKVTSAVVKIILREQPLVELADEELFAKIVKLAFAKRRKTILNNLRSAGLSGYGEEEIAALLERTGIAGGRRGETLSAEEFGRLSNAFFHKNHSVAVEQ